jgi:hypothetical protein
MDRGAPRSLGDVGHYPSWHLAFLLSGQTPTRQIRSRFPTMTTELSTLYHHNCSTLLLIKFKNWAPAPPNHLCTAHLQKLQLQMPLHLGQIQSSLPAASSALSPYLRKPDHWERNCTCWEEIEDGYLPVKEALAAVLDWARTLLLDLLTRRCEVRCLLAALQRTEEQNESNLSTS